MIQCEIAKKNKEGVNPIKKNHVINSIKNLRNKYPDGKIIPFMHWSYELEGEPQPFERELARMLIDIGAEGVIGCHPHRIGGFEVYKEKPILYSLGNWMFKQGFYHDKKLNFPSFCDLELAFEWDFDNNDFLFHFFKYDRINSSLAYSHTENKHEHPTMKEYTPFENLPPKEYSKWYKKNHYHKNKGLPIYYWKDSDFNIYLKNNLIIIRDFFISQILKFRK